MTDDYRSPNDAERQPGVPESARPVLGAPPQLPLPPSPAPASAQGPTFAPQGRSFSAPQPVSPTAPGGYSPPPTAGPINPETKSRRRITYWVLGAAALVGVLFAIVSFASDSDERALSSSDDAVLTEPFPAEDSDVAEEDSTAQGPAFFFDPIRPDSVAIDASSVWVSDAACGVVIQIDKATEEVVGAVNVGDSASGVAVAGGSVWVGTRDEGKVVRIDPARLEVQGSVAVPGSALGLTARGNDVWATDPLLGVVYRIDAARSALVETVSVGADPHHVAIGDRTVWVTNQLGNTVTMIDLGGRGAAVEVPVGSQPLHVELGAGSAWVTDSADGAVRRLNENTGEVQAVITVGRWPHALAFANGYAWVGTETGSFWKVDPATNEATRVDGADFASIDTAVDGSDIWVADASGGTVIRFDAAAGAVGSVIDLNEYGDCETFRDEAINPPRRDTDL